MNSLLSDVSARPRDPTRRLVAADLEYTHHAPLARLSRTTRRVVAEWFTFGASGGPPPVRSARREHEEDRDIRRLRIREE